MVNDRFLLDDEGLLQVDDDAAVMNVPHCVRCRAPLAPGVAYPRPGPFCQQCIEDIIASARSFGGSPGDVAERYNAKLLSFLPNEGFSAV